MRETTQLTHEARSFMAWPRITKNLGPSSEGLCHESCHRGCSRCNNEARDRFGFNTQLTQSLLAPPTEPEADQHEAAHHGWQWQSPHGSVRVLARAANMDVNYSLRVEER